MQYLLPCWLWACTEPNFRPVRNRTLQIAPVASAVQTSLLALGLSKNKFYRSRGQQLRYLPPCWRWTCTELNFRDLTSNTCTILTSSPAFGLDGRKLFDLCEKNWHMLLRNSASSLLALAENVSTERCSEKTVDATSTLAARALEQSPSTLLALTQGVRSSNHRRRY